MFQTILIILKAIPALKSLVDTFISWYVQTEIKGFKEDVRAGIRAAVHDHDQRDIEKAIGSTGAGEPSGIAGTEIRDSLPGVKP